MFERLQSMETANLQSGQRLNREKYHGIIVGRSQTTALTLCLIHEIESSDSVMYLGTQITNKGGPEPEMKGRISMVMEDLCRQV